MDDPITDQPEEPAINWKHAESAIRDPASHLRLWGLAVVGLIADLWSKSWAFSSLEVGEKRVLVPHALDLQLSLNPGALFGLGPGLVLLFIVASIAALGFVLFFFTGTARGQKMVHVSLAMILAGALGNLYDRTFVRYDMATLRGSGQMMIGEVVGEPDDQAVSITLWGGRGEVVTYDRSELDGGVRRVGVVRDFLKITPRLGALHIWPWVFNVADVFLVVGVTLLILNLWVRARSLRRSAAPVVAETAGEAAGE